MIENKREYTCQFYSCYGYNNPIELVSRYVCNKAEPSWVKSKNSGLSFQRGPEARQVYTKS